MGARVPHKVFRWNEPKGKRLAKEVFERCKRNAVAYTRSHRGCTAVVFAERGLKSDFFLMFKISGRTPADNARMRAWWKDAGSPPSALEDYIHEDLGMIDLGSGHAASLVFGWQADVSITLKGPEDEPIFDVSIKKTGDVPREILRCLESTYNDLVVEGGLRDES